MLGDNYNFVLAYILAMQILIIFLIILFDFITIKINMNEIIITSK